MIRNARARHPGLEFRRTDVHEFDCDEQFDVIICSDLVNELWDVQRALMQARRLSHAGTRLIVNSYSRLWEIPRRAAERLRLEYARFTGAS